MTLYGLEDAQDEDIVRIFFGSFPSSAVKDKARNKVIILSIFYVHLRFGLVTASGRL